MSVAMTLIPEKEAGELRAYLESNLTGPVTMDLFVGPLTGLWIPGRIHCDTCEDALTLLGEVASLSDRISAEPEATAAEGLAEDEVPAVVLAGAANGRARFLGIPGGLEFGTLLRSLIDVRRGATSLAEATKQALRGLGRDAHIRVFVTPSCPFCPRVVLTKEEIRGKGPEYVLRDAGMVPVRTDAATLDAALSSLPREPPPHG